MKVFKVIITNLKSTQKSKVEVKFNFLRFLGTMVKHSSAIKSRNNKYAININKTTKEKQLSIYETAYD